MTQIERLMYVRVTSCVEGVHFTLQTDRTNFVFPSSRIILHTKDLKLEKMPLFDVIDVTDWISEHHGNPLLIKGLVSISNFPK